MDPHERIINCAKKQLRKYGKCKDEAILVLDKESEEDFIKCQLAELNNSGNGSFTRRKHDRSRPEYVQYCCSRSEKSKGKKTGSSETRANSCTASISFKFVHGLSWRACHVRKNMSHTGHNVNDPSEACVNTIDKDLVSYIEYLVLQGLKPSEVLVRAGQRSQSLGKEDMRDRTYFPSPKDIQNIQQQVLAKTRLDSNDCVSVSKLCQGSLKDDVVFYQQRSNANNQPLIIVIQSGFQKEQLLKYGQNSTIFVDATYRGITAYGYAFYAVVCRNKFGRGIPIAWIITSQENKETLALAFTKLRECGTGTTEHFIPRCIMVDKDMTEIATMKSVWPESTVLLCWFHVLQAVHRWLVKANGGGLSGERNTEKRNKVIHTMNSLKYCRTKKEFDAKLEEGLAMLDELLGSSVVSMYLTNEWVPCSDMWSNYGRRVFHQYSNTNNIVERFFFSLKYQFLKGFVNRRVDDLLKLLTSKVMDYYRYLDGIQAAGRVANKFEQQHANSERLGHQMMNQGLDSAMVHIKNGICKVPSQTSPQDFSHQVDVVRQLCSNFSCNGIRCKHLVFAELALIKKGINTDQLLQCIVDDIVKGEHFTLDADQGIFSVFSTSDLHQDDDTCEIYDTNRNVCSCVAHSLGRKCIAVHCWSVLQQRETISDSDHNILDQDLPASPEESDVPGPSQQNAEQNAEQKNAEQNAEQKNAEQKNAEQLNAEQKNAEQKNAEQNAKQLANMICEINKWKDSGEFHYTKEIASAASRLHHIVFSKAKVTTQKRKIESVIAYRFSKKSKKNTDHNNYTLELNKGSQIMHRPIRSYNPDGSFAIKSTSTRVLPIQRKKKKGGKAKPADKKPAQK